MRIVRDTIAYGAEHMARYNPVNISGYHISEAGANALQEAAFTMAITRAYVREVTDAGVDVDTFAPRLSFFFVSQADLFEEVAKFRAVRRFYAKMMREHFGAKKAESMRLRFHAQTAAATLTKPQPVNNVVRTALQALSRGARRHAVAAHQRARRGVHDPVGVGDEVGAADAADHRRRDEGDEHDRPAGRLVLRRSP